MADFEFNCPHCGKKLLVNTSIIGRKGTCKYCSGVVIVPKPKTDSKAIENISQKTISICPYCRTIIKEFENVQVCPSCKTPHHQDCWMENKGCTVYGCENAPPDEEKISVQMNDMSSGDTTPIFLYIPLSRLIFMSIISFGLYESYWIYKNWRYIKERDQFYLGKGDKTYIQPFWRGIFGIFYCYSLLKSIHSDHIANNYEKAKFSAGGLASGWIILRLLSNALGRADDIGANLLGLIISFPTFLFFVPVQNYINRVNSIKQPKPEYNLWSSGHILCLIIGLIIWLLYLIGFSA